MAAQFHERPPLIPYTHSVQQVADVIRGNMSTMAAPRARLGERPSAESHPETPRGSAIRALVIDAHPVIRWGLLRVMDQQPDMQAIGEAGSAFEALDQIASLRPDVVTVGVTLPDCNGLDLVRDLRDRYPDLGIVVLTTRSDDGVLFSALDRGASAFVSKHADAAEVLAAIRHAAAAASSFTAAGLAQAMRRRAAQPQSPLLSTREFQVLELLRDGCSIPQVGSRLHLSLSTAKTYVARLYDKLGAANRAQALMSAVRLGLLEESAPAVIDLTQAYAR
jgi:DNA-binding NarL/FixJ family response regulator